MQNLITDRAQDNVIRLKELSKKGFSRMSESEKSEWLGDPFATSGANLLPPGSNVWGHVDLKHQDNAFIVTTDYGATNLSAGLEFGDPQKFSGKTLTLSVENIRTFGGGTPRLELLWWGSAIVETGGVLEKAGSVTFTLGEAPSWADSLCLIFSVAPSGVYADAGAQVRYEGVMLEVGTEPHKYVPYTEILPTRTTKGAYNYSDLNRVERAVAEISDYTGMNLVTKTDWTVDDIPRSADMERYLRNIRIIRNAFSIDTDIPVTADKLTHVGANNIEKVLVDTYKQFENATCCDELFCGEV